MAEKHRLLDQQTAFGTNFQVARVNYTVKRLDFRRRTDTLAPFVASDKGATRGRKLLKSHDGITIKLNIGFRIKTVSTITI
jgi:hypothetical protein